MRRASAVAHATPTSNPLWMSGSKIAGGPSPNVAGLAVGAVGCAVRQGTLAAAPATVTIIDYSRPSTEPRLWVIDSITGEVLYRELVAHGRNSGDNNASRFSNRPNSLESSLGLFQTADAYVGKNGYSLRLRGLEPGVCVFRTIVNAHSGRT